MNKILSRAAGVKLLLTFLIGFSVISFSACSTEGSRSVNSPDLPHNPGTTVTTVTKAPG